MVGDVVIVKPDERIAADGFVIKGDSAVNQAPVTGESIPVDKHAVSVAAQARANSDRLDAASRVFANEIVQGAPFLKGYLQTDLRKVVERKAAVIQHWIDEGKLAPIDPYHLIFLIWAATQHYADFIPQIKAVMNVSRLNQGHFRKVEQSLSRIILHGVLAEKAR